jgi:hypothetical protein
LSKGRFALVDYEDMEMLSGFVWHLAADGSAAANVGSGRATARGAYMHRMIMLPDPGHEVDHANGDKLDNRRYNLRVCSRKENCRNVRCGTANTSGYKGVSWNKQAGKWRAFIKTNKRQRFLGHFADEAAAACAYDEAAREMFGDFARLNFPDEIAR